MTMPIARCVGAVALAAGLASCVHQNELVPAPGAQVLAGEPRVAEETVAGVHVVVDSHAWRSGPVQQVLSPVRVTLENGSDHPLRVAYNEFTLGGSSGFRLAALPPVAVAAANPTPPVDPAFVYGGFHLAPWYARFYRHPFGVWTGAFPMDPAYYDRYYPGWPAGLPDQEVLRQGLPEGVLDPGGHVAGFLYFHDQPKGTQLTFLGSLVDASTGQPFGTVQIPFRVK